MKPGSVDIHGMHPGVDGLILSEFSLYGVHNWTTFELSGVANGSVTVEFGSTGHAIYGPAAYHIDALVLTPEPASLTLFCLTGVALMSWRRRSARATRIASLNTVS